MASGFGSIVARYRRLGFGWSLLLLLGCTAEPVATLCPVVSSNGEQSSDSFRRRKLDVLFVIDNTGSMAAKQQALVASLQAFLGVLDVEGHQTDYHMGFATTDVGSWVSPEQPWTMTAGACDSLQGMTESCKRCHVSTARMDRQRRRRRAVHSVRIDGFFRWTARHS